MPLTKATQNVITAYPSDTTINGVAIGRGAGNINSNTVLGAGSLQANTTGYNNTAVGVQTLDSNTTGINNTAVGTLALQASVLYSNTSGIGYDAQVSGDNQVRIGNSSVTSVTCQTNAWSDELPILTWLSPET